MTQALWIALAVGALIGAFLIDTVPGWLRFGADDQFAAGNTIRIGLVILAALIVLIALKKGHGLWIDTLVLTAVALIVIAVGAAYLEARPKNKAVEHARAIFDLPATLIRATQIPAGGYERNAEVVLIVMRKEVGENGATSISSHRYKAKLSEPYPLSPNDEFLSVSIERGDADSQARDLSTDLEQLARIRLLPKS